MNCFPEGTHVWLRSRVRRGHYLYADEDGSGVSLSTNRTTLNAAWQVHRIVRQEVTYVLLRGAAYGRYLAVTAFLAEDGHRGREVAQRDFIEPEQLNIRWWAESAADKSGDVLLSCSFADAKRHLRVNGKYRRWNNGVSADFLPKESQSTMANWTVLHIPPRPAPPALPTPSADLGVPTGLLRRRTEPVMERQRTIHYIRADDKGNVLDTVTISFLGRSVFNLRNEVTRPSGVDMFTTTLCVHAGFYGRPTPLIVDLPRNEDPLNIVVVPNSLAASMGLQHPNVDAPEPAPTIAEEPKKRTDDSNSDTKT